MGKPRQGAAAVTFCGAAQIVTVWKPGAIEGPGGDAFRPIQTGKVLPQDLVALERSATALADAGTFSDWHENRNRQMTKTTNDHMTGEIIIAGVLGKPDWAVLMITTRAGEIFRFGLPAAKLRHLGESAVEASRHFRYRPGAPGH